MISQRAYLLFVFSGKARDLLFACEQIHGGENEDVGLVLLDEKLNWQKLLWAADYRGFCKNVLLNMKRHRVQMFYSGRVQGVGFRYSTKTVAAGFEATGTVRNLPDGRVELVAEGEKKELEEFLQAIRDSEVGGFIRQEQAIWAEAKGEFRGFGIIR